MDLRIKETYNIDKLKSLIRDIPNFPKDGIIFKDITPLLMSPQALEYILDVFYDHYKDKGITKVCGIESRGFILGGALAAKLKAGFIPIRKPNKLPYFKYSETYELEYGLDSIEIHTDAISPEDVVLLHDDILATGGTMRAAVNLIRHFGVKKSHVNFLCELEFLKGLEKLKDVTEVYSLISL